MNDTAKMLIKLGVIGLAGYLGYRYLQSSGAWAQLMSALGISSNSFADANQLISYCQANPNGQATFTGASSPVTKPCSQWLAAVAQNPPAQSSLPPGAPLTPPVTPAALNALQQNVLNAAAAGTGQNPATAQMNADQWNWYWSHVSGVEQTADLFPAGNRNALLSFPAYLAARAAQGLSGRPPQIAAQPFQWTQRYPM